MSSNNWPLDDFLNMGDFELMGDSELMSIDELDAYFALADDQNGQMQPTQGQTPPESPTGYLADQSALFGPLNTIDPRILEEQTPPEAPAGLFVDQSAFFGPLDDQNPRPLSDEELVQADVFLAVGYNHNNNQMPPPAAAVVTPIAAPITAPVAAPVPAPQRFLEPKDMASNGRYKPKKQNGPQAQSAAAQKRQHEKEHGPAPQVDRPANRRGATPGYKVALYDHKQHCRKPADGCRPDCQLRTEFEDKHTKLRGQRIPKPRTNPDADPFKHLPNDVRVKLWDHVTPEDLVAP